MNGLMVATKEKNNIEIIKNDGLGEVVTAIVNSNTTFVESLDLGSDAPIKSVENLMSDMTPREVNAMLGVASNKTFLESLNGLTGKELQAKTVILNANLIKSTGRLPFVGKIASFNPIQTALGGTLYEVYALNSQVIKSNGDIGENEEITVENVFTPISTLERRKREPKQSGVLEYTFDVKKKSDDIENYPLKRGHNSVDVTGLAFDDSSVNSTQKTFSQTLVGANEKSVTMKIDYDLGKITLTLEDDTAIADGEMIFFEASLSSKKLSETRSVIGVDITSEKYQPKIVNISTSTNVQDREELVANLQLGILPQNEQSTLNKISNEILGKACSDVPAIAKEFTQIDLTTETYITKAEKFKKVLSEINKCAKAIAKESGIAGAGRVSIIGGSFLFDLYNLSASNNEGMTKAYLGEDNAIVNLGKLMNSFDVIYYPLYDEENPKDSDGYDNFTVVGNPYEEGKKIFIEGMAIPVHIVEGLGVDADLNEEVPYTGQVIYKLNRNPKSRLLAKKIKVKA